MYEQAPKPDIEKEEVIKTLKENPENLELLKSWYQQSLEKVEAIVSPEESGEASILFDIEYATLLKEAGLFEEAWNVLNDSVDKASNFKQENLLQQMKDLMKEIESQS